MDKDIIIGRLYAALVEKEQQLQLTIQALIALKMGTASLDQLEVTETSWQIHPAVVEEVVPEPTLRAIRGRRLNPPLDPTPITGE